jgi:hypothetical protein
MLAQIVFWVFWNIGAFLNPLSGLPLLCLCIWGWIKMEKWGYWISLGYFVFITINMAIIPLAQNKFVHDFTHYWPFTFLIVLDIFSVLCIIGSANFYFGRGFRSGF